MKTPENVQKRIETFNEKADKVLSELSPFIIQTGYSSYLKNVAAAPTRLAYLSDVRDFLNFTIGKGIIQAESVEKIDKEDIENIKGRDVNRYLSALAAGEVTHIEKRKKLKNGNAKAEDTEISTENSVASVCRRRASLISFFDYLARQEYVKANITGNIDKVKGVRKDNDNIKLLYEDEVMKMLDLVRTGEGLTKREHFWWEKTKKRDYLILLLFVTYGLRLFELTALNLSSFNLTEDNLLVYRKEGKERKFPLNNQVKNALIEYTESERKTLIAQNKASNIMENEETAEDALFISQQGKRLSERQIRDLVYKYTKHVKEDGEALSPHKLRATVATSLLNRGVDIFKVQDYMDHENVSTTQVYTKHREEEKAEVLKNFGWE